MTHDYKHEVRDYNNGQIWGWNGCACPVHPKDVVEVWFRGHDPDITLAGSLPWTHYGHFDDIIAFKVVKPYVEPKVIWVNEYPDELVAHHDRLSAISSSTPRATRIAVRYIEAVNEKEAQE